MSEPDDDLSTERVYTPGMKRRSCVRVLKNALHDAQRELGRDRVVGVFGIVVREDGSASLLSALTHDELKIVMQAVPEGLNKVAVRITKGEGVGQ